MQEDQGAHLRRFATAYLYGHLDRVHETWWVPHHVWKRNYENL
jgi:hypothetical protein